MSNSTPVQLITELTFNNTSQLSIVNMPFPNHLGISSDGRYISLSNSSTIFLFDLNNPDASWQPGIEATSINSVMPTNSGGYWVSQSRAIQFINSDGQCTLHCASQDYEKVWGEDDWFLTHDGAYLRYANTLNSSITKGLHKDVILHAWKHGESIRLLSMSKHKKHLYLHEWNKITPKPALINSFRYTQKFSISGLDACYMTTKHIHAWPLEDGAMLIKMMPWAISVSADGEMSISDDHVAWHPIYLNGHQSLSRQQLAEFTACSLSEGIDPQASFGSTPFLVTTLDNHDDIHFISSRWHKKLSRKDFPHISDDLLNASLDDIDVATLVLANSEYAIPPVENMADNILEMTAKKQYQKILNIHQAEIEAMFAHAFSDALGEIIQANEVSLSNGLDFTYHGIEMLRKNKFLPRAFFSALYKSKVNHLEYETVASLLRMLIPVLPTKWQVMMPARLLNTVSPLIDTVQQVDTDAAVFLLNKAPNHFFDVDNAVLLLQHFVSEPEALDIIFEKTICNRCITTDSDGMLNRRIRNAIEKQLHDHKTFKDNALLQMVKHGITIAKNSADLHNEIACSFQSYHTPVETIAGILAYHSLPDKQDDMDFVMALVDTTISNRLLPLFIYTMKGLLAANDRSDLVALSITCDLPDQILENDYSLVEAIWQQGEQLEESSRWAYAISLLTSAWRCLGNSRISILKSGDVDVFLTNEARLLQQNQANKINPVQAMLSCIASEYGMSGMRREVSTSIMQHYQAWPVRGDCDEQ